MESRLKRRIATALTVVVLAVGSFAATEPTGYERAQSLLERGVVFEAIRELENFVAANANHIDARMLLARTLTEVKRGRRAAEEAAHVLRIDPGHAEAQRLLTETRIELGRSLDRDDPVAVLDYARLCARPETYERAETYYKLYFELADNPAVRLEFANMLSWAGRHEEAVRQFRGYLAFAPEDIDARRSLGRVYNAMARFDEAVVELTYCLERRPDDIEIKLDLARALSWSGHERDAQGLLRDVRRQAPNYDAPLLLLAAIARIQGRQQEEYNLYLKVLEISPDNVEARSRVTELESGSNLKIAELRARLEKSPDDLPLRWELVALYERDEQHGEAIRELEEIAARAPFDSESRARLQAIRAEEGARVLARLEAIKAMMGEERRAEIARCTEWLASNPADARTREVLSELLLADGRYEDSVDQLEVLLASDAADAHIREKLARAQARLELSKTEARRELLNKQRQGF